MKDAEVRFLTERNDTIDNAVFDAIRSLVHEDGEVEWNMGIIGEIEDTIESMLIERGIITCRPWYDDNKNICYKVDRCYHCKRGVGNV